MKMRTDIFYWKCDCPISLKEKKEQFSAAEFTESAHDQVDAVVRKFLGHSPEKLNILPSDGNHHIAIITDKNQQFFFRADEGPLTEDIYLLAESTVMNLLHKNGFPVPEVHLTDISMKDVPFRFQIMDFSTFPCLNKFAKAGTLDEKKIAVQSGNFLGKLHSLHFPGFGFFNTDKLLAGDSLQGLDNSAAAYFRKCLDKHLNYLTSNQLLEEDKENRIRTAFERAMPLLDGIQGTLLHRDYAYWNILGTETEIKQVIDWDDSISGDPADDFGIIGCFLSEELIGIILEEYKKYHPVDDSFITRIHLHTLRNMLWKAVIRSSMGYFDRGKDFFLTGPGGMPLKEYTFLKIDNELKQLEILL